MKYAVFLDYALKGQKNQYQVSLIRLQRRFFSLTHSVLSESEPSVETIKTVECSVCQYIISYLDIVLENNKSDAAVEAALKQVCSVLPPTSKDRCLEFVITYGPLIPQLIMKYGTPDLVCKALQLCNSLSDRSLSQPCKFICFESSSITIDFFPFNRCFSSR